MRNLNPFGLFVVSIGVIASFCISIYQGLQFSDAAWKAAIWAAMGAAAVTWEMIGWHRSAHLLREGRRLAFVANLAGLVLATVVTILLFELAFLATALEGMASRNVVAMDNRATLERERDSLQRSIDKGGAVRGLAAIDSDIAGIKLHPRWASTHGCTPEWITAKLSRKLCERYSAAVGERGQALSTQAAQKRIREISTLLTPLGDVGAADARALYISRLFGISQETARMLVSAGVVAFLWFCRAVAPFTMWDARNHGGNRSNLRGEDVESISGVEVRQPNEYAPVENVAVLERSGGDALDGVTDQELDELLYAEAQEEIAAAERRQQAHEAPPSPKIQAVTQPAISTATPVAGLPGGASHARDAAAVMAGFVNDCLMVDAEGYEASATLWQSFVVWAKDKEQAAMDRTTFGVLIGAAVAQSPFNGRKAKKRVAGASVWVYTGVRLRPLAAHRVERQSSAELLEMPLARERVLS